MRSFQEYHPVQGSPRTRGARKTKFCRERNGERGEGSHFRSFASRRITREWLLAVVLIADLALGQDDFENDQLDIDLDKDSEFGVSDGNLEGIEFDKSKSPSGQTAKDFGGGKANIQNNNVISNYNNTPSMKTETFNFADDDKNLPAKAPPTQKPAANVPGKAPTTSPPAAPQPAGQLLPLQKAASPAPVPVTSPTPLPSASTPTATSAAPPAVPATPPAANSWFPPPAPPEPPVEPETSWIGEPIEQPAQAQPPAGPDPIPEATASPRLVPSDPNSNSTPDAPPIMPKNEFGGAPPIPGTLRNLAEGEGPEEYTIEEGDTLFDIGDQLIDEPAYWPKLWALNPDIRNPHFIYPGMRLRFYPGDDENPPYLQVVNEDDTVPIDRGGLKESELAAVDVSSLLMDNVSPDPVEVVGPGGIGSSDIESDFVMSGEMYRPQTMQLTLPGFIFPDEKQALGSIVSGLQGRILADGENQAIIKVDSDLKPGSTYTLLRPSGEVRDANGDFIGYRYEFVGHVQIGEAQGDGFVAGRLINTRLGGSPGDIAVEFMSTNRSITLSDLIRPSSSASGLIIGFDYATQDSGGAGNFVFINQNLQRGAIVPVVQELRRYATKFDYDLLPEGGKQVGLIQIIDSTPSSAIGYVLQSTIGLRVGDQVGKG